MFPRESNAIATGLSRVFEPPRVAIGGTFPFDPAAYTVMLLEFGCPFPRFKTYRFPAESSAIPVGAARPVNEPAILALGVALPLLPGGNTETLPLKLAT